MRTPVSVGVVGLGVTGREFARVFSELPGARLAWLCDSDPSVRLRVQSEFQGPRLTGEIAELLNDEELDAVVIATPAGTRYDCALAALESDKHLLVEEPLASMSAQAEELIATALRRHRCLAVGHTLAFHPAITALKDSVDSGRLGDVYFVYANRQELGEVRHDENALWALGTQDVAALLLLLDDQPVEVAAHGEAYLQQGVPDFVFCYLRFATGISAHLHLSWYDPNTVRRLTVVGSKQMAVFDDTHAHGKLTFHECAPSSEGSPSSGSLALTAGDVISPRLRNDRPLRLECEDFLAAVRSPVRSVRAARHAAAVVHVLAGLQQSLDSGGAPVQLESGFEPAAPVAHPIARVIRGGRQG